MDMNTLFKKIDEIGWEEQMNFWLSEKYPDSIEENSQRLHSMLVELGSQINPAILDEMEYEGEIAWSLRLSLYVDSDDSMIR